MRQCDSNNPFGFLYENKAHSKIKDGQNMGSQAIDVQNMKTVSFFQIQPFFSLQDDYIYGNDNNYYSLIPHHKPGSVQSGRILDFQIAQTDDSTYYPSAGAQQ